MPYFHNIFWHLRLCSFGEAALPRAGQFLETVKDSLATAPFICKPISPEPTPPPLLYRVLPLSQHSPALKPQDQAHKTPCSPAPHSPLKLFRPAIPKGFPGGSDAKKSDAMQETHVRPTSVFLPGESHGQRSLAGYSSLGLQRVKHD